jgi:5-methylcytosine-specific restriction endonuclease McrA
MSKKTKKTRAAVYHTNKKFDTADRLLAELVKKLYLIENDRIQCYTCSSIKNVNQIEAGHYISRGNLNTRWMIENVKPQCIECNRNKNGNIDEYTKRLDQDFPGLSETLKKLGKTTINKNTFEITDVIKNLKGILKLL